MVNTSPEPVTNWTASVGEDVAVVGGLALVFAYPWVALGLALLITVMVGAALWCFGGGGLALDDPKRRMAPAR